MLFCFQQSKLPSTAQFSQLIFVTLWYIYEKRFQDATLRRPTLFWLKPWLLPNDPGFSREGQGILLYYINLHLQSSRQQWIQNIFLYLLNPMCIESFSYKRTGKFLYLSGQVKDKFWLMLTPSLMALMHSVYLGDEIIITRSQWSIKILFKWVTK